MMFSKTSLTTSLLAAATLLSSVAQADMLMISNPTRGTTWKVGETVFLQWKGNCASMGNQAAKSVDVNLMTGPENTLRFVAKLASIDCSGTNTRKEFVIPADVVAQSGNYSLQAQTGPQLSYSPIFTIETAAGEAPVPGSGAGTGDGSNPGQTGAGGVAHANTASSTSTPIQNKGGSAATASAVALAAVLIAAQLL
ncbi:hypothetical protein BGZ83_010817 [Gryganskiella cystojenkinii]|nr:hypothetical protein BGZ83_010817 [Gryganskiella cystojenkinii]